MRYTSAQSYQLLICTIIFIILQSLGYTATFSAFTTPTPQACNCMRVKECEAFSTLLLSASPTEAESIYAIVRNAYCGKLGNDPLVCCPTTNRAHTTGIIKKEDWIWDRRPYRTDELPLQSVTNRFAPTLNDNFYSKTNVVDFEDPQTFQNCPQPFYEHDQAEAEALEQSLFAKNQQTGYRQQQARDHLQRKYKLENFPHFQHDHDVEGDDQLLSYHFDRTTEHYQPEASISYRGKKPTNHRIIFPTDPSLMNRRKTTGVRENGRTTTGSSLLSTTKRTPKPTNAVRAIRKSAINSANCGFSIGTRIIGGIEGHNGQFSWITRIGYINTTSNRISYRCSGSVISDGYVLTAAHCVTNLVPNLKLFHVLVGDMEVPPNCRSNPGSCQTRQTYNIENVIIHGGYDRPKYANDIALLRILHRDKLEVNYGTICLPLNNSVTVANELTGKSGIVAGWSTNNEGVEITTTPSVKYLRLPIVNTTECAINYAKYSENFKDPIVITPSQLCAQGQPMHDVCRGDSGGPFMDDGSSGLLNSNGRYTLLGIVAFGPTICGASNFPGVYTRVSSYVDWIVENIS